MARVACTGVACAGGVHTGDAHAGGAHAGDACTGGARTGVVGTLSQSDYRWGHSANQITQGLCARMRVQGLRAQGVHAGVVGTLSQSEQEVRGGVHGGARRCMEVCGGVHGGARRGYHWLPLATIDLVGDNGEF